MNVRPVWDAFAEVNDAAGEALAREPAGHPSMDIPKVRR